MVKLTPTELERLRWLMERISRESNNMVNVIADKNGDAVLTNLDSSQMLSLLMYEGGDSLIGIDDGEMDEYRLAELAAKREYVFDEETETFKFETA